uniref:Uncharacterized protein n=1 Tax=Oryza sativa subsp. japonica TaxID=39947 RepID=Q67UG7_ORYSJ|nr:hypothetical protein [Oryza sativa Japonica Group]
MNWAKIHKSAEWSNRGGHQPKLGWIGLGGSAEPILAPLDSSFGVDVQDCIPMTVGGHFGQFLFHNRHN